MIVQHVEPKSLNVWHNGNGLFYKRQNRPIWGVLLFLFPWICIWTIGGAGAFHQLGHEGPADGKYFLMFWLVGWAVGWFYAVGTIIWMLFGAESLTANAVTLTHTLHVGPLNYSRHYKAASLENMRWREGSNWPAFTFRRGSKPAAIEAEYGTKVLSFLRGIERPEANKLIGRLRSALNMRAAA